jgi:16S rRNA (adenine1518-N6/adenine1519-N6)-dimethyltransferase
MFQKEVAERVAAKPGSKAYGVISILLQAHYAVDYLFDVPPHCFTPPPQVMSGVIRLTRRDELPDFRSWPDFQRIVKAAFTQRRKTLRNGLKGILPPEVLVDTLFERRAETLSVDEFAALTHRLPARTKN